MADIEKLNPSELVSAELLGDLRKIIDSARSHVAATANYELTAMYWHIGDRINRDVLNNERAEYGQQIVSHVATQLQQEYGTKGFDEKKYPSNDAICPDISRFSNCRTTGAKIVMVSFSNSYAD